MVEFVFWTAAGLLVYAYLLFPLLLLVRGLVFRRKIQTEAYEPTVSIVVVAHNEEAAIGGKLENLSLLDYPRQKLQIVVASDGSTDQTNRIVREHHSDVQLLELPRRGKIPALNDAVSRATGEVLVFSDANSLFSREALKNLLRPLADARVGAVAGNQVYERGEGNRASFGERLYWSFDRWLKAMQSRSGSVIGATGAIYAIRRSLFQTVPPAVSDDFVISARAVEQGFLLAFAPQAVATEATAPSDRAEFRRRTRIIVRGLRALWVLKRLFNPFRYGFYAIQIFSHKFLRWSGGWLLLATGISNALLVRNGTVYLMTGSMQLLLYATALAAWIWPQQWRVSVFKLLLIPYYFCLVNLATIRAWLMLPRGRQLDRWDSTHASQMGNPD